MTSQILRDARKYEEEKERKIAVEPRPQFHLSARVGWMNDPNGFSFYQGEYHLFYQYHPYSAYWGPMHWGHAVSKDLLHWKQLPTALAPDMDYDSSGCFSGNAIIMPDGKHLLMYTGVSKESQADGITKDIQTQCLAIGDGIDYEKYSGNPVIDKNDLPENASKYDFRDPKIWRQADGSYRCIAGNCDASHDGQILLFSSPDGFNWKYEKVLASNNGRYGKMWECPDFFDLDGKQVLLVSPQDMMPKGFEYHNGNGTLCLIGSYDDASNTFVEECDQAVDYGIDFYAPQTIKAPDGRRIMIGWMQNWDTCNLHAPERPWFGQMSIPRELSIKNGRLFQSPIRELKTLRANEIKYENVSFSDIIKLEGIAGRRIDMEVSVRPEDETDIYKKFSVRFAQNDTYQTSVSFRPYESIAKIDRKHSGSRRAIIHQRRCLVNSEKGKIKIRIILDTFSAEVFINDGEYALSMTLYTDSEVDGISFFADGRVTMDIVKYDLLDK